MINFTGFLQNSLGSYRGLGGWQQQAKK